MSDVVAYSEGDAADIAMCKAVADTLQRHYPNHQWLVGISDREKGMIAIDLPHKPPSLRLYGYLLYPWNAWDDAAVKKAGGEWLERIGLARAAARPDAEERAAEHGLDIGNVITKSRA
jgi:hypothetical protein